MAMRTKKQNPPRDVDQWMNYYEALKNNKAHENFRGSCSRRMIYETKGEGETQTETVLSLANRKESGTWNSIVGYYKLQKGLSKEKIIKLHPWALPNRSKWTDSEGKRFYQGKLTNDWTLLTPHHLISCAVTQAIYRDWQRIIENEICYNVNCAENLFILPNSAMLACHLKIPLHEAEHVEGNLDDYISIKEYNYCANLKVGGKPLFDMHEYVFNDTDPNKSTRDAGENKLEVEKFKDGMAENAKITHLNKHMLLRAYHSKVFKLLAFFLNKYFKKCNDYNRKEFIAGMNKLSKKILKYLAKFKWILHSTGTDYKPDSKRGCCGVDVIKTHGNSNIDDINYDGKFMQDKSETLKLKSGERLGDCFFERNHEIIDKNFFNKNFRKTHRRRGAGLKVASEFEFKL